MLDKNHCIFNGELKDVVIHSKLKISMDVGLLISGGLGLEALKLLATQKNQFLYLRTKLLMVL